MKMLDDIVMIIYARGVCGFRWKANISLSARKQKGWRWRVDSGDSYWEIIIATDGKSYNIEHYNLQTIIAVDFKVSNDYVVLFRKPDKLWRIMQIKAGR